MSSAWRIGAGVTLVVAGTAMLVLPGPGIVVLVAGLALLERDVPAAARAGAWLRGFLPARSVDRRDPAASRG